MNHDIDTLLENQTLKNEFAIRNLDLSQVFFPTPDNLERENRALEHLLDWVQKYQQCGSREIMEQDGYKYPPIDPDFSPENDWFIFEKWMNGESVQKTIREQLPDGYTPRQPDSLNDEEIEAELQKLEDLLYAIRIVVDYKEGTPPRLRYSHLLKQLDEKMTIMNDGFWIFDGCGGCCPFCFQRPWCEPGCESCWPEDEKAGEMFLIDASKRYVSATCVSLQILQQCQQKQDAEYEEFLKSREKNLPLDTMNSELDDDDFPF